MRRPTRSTTIVAAATTAIGLFAAAHAQQLRRAAPANPTAVKVDDAEKATATRLDQLPDDQVVDLAGEQMTAGELRARQRADRQKMEQAIAALARQAQSAFEQRRSEFERRQTGELQRERAKAQAELGKLRSSGDQPRQPAKLPLRPELKKIEEPRITGGLGVVEAGAPLIIGGSGFGAQPGWVELRGAAFGGAAQARRLVIEEWHPGGIGGKVPTDLGSWCPTGVVRVYTQAGRPSNTWTFVVPQAYEQLPKEDVRVVTCDDDANTNQCNGVSHSGATCFSGFNCPSDIPPAGSFYSSIWSRHCNCCGAVGDDSGTDVYEISLKNGWVLDSAHFLSGFLPGEASTTPPSGGLPAGFQDGADHWRPAVQWRVTPCDWVHYTMVVDIRGPACAPHK